jgi:hypothetical protein
MFAVVRDVVAGVLGVAILVFGFLTATLDVSSYEVSAGPVVGPIAFLVGHPTMWDVPVLFGMVALIVLLVRRPATTR